MHEVDGGRNEHNDTMVADYRDAMRQSGRCRAVVFDFGGVLITPITNQVGELAARHGVSVTTMLEVLLGPHESGDHPWHRAERSELAVADIQALLAPWATRHGITLDGDEIGQLLRDGGYTVVEPMRAKAAALTAGGVLTGLLTNTFAEYSATLQQIVPFETFTTVIESYAVGTRKPEPAIYEATQQRLGVAPDEIVYLDDFVQNIDAARAHGWQTIHVTDPYAAVDLIDAFLVLRD
jgi:putative hydrolase of the HAD superfamily